jgi:two-component system, sensor histidine kinase
MNERLATGRRQQAALIKTAVGIAITALVAVSWVFTFAFMRATERDATQRLDAMLANLAAGVQWQIENSAEQAQRILARAAAAWQLDPDHFNAAQWLAAASVNPQQNIQIVQIDAAGIVTSSSDAALVGQRPAKTADLVSPDQSYPVPDGDGAISQGAHPGELVLSRPLLRADGVPAGGLVLTWRVPTQLPNWDLGPGGVIALLNTDGNARLLAPKTDAAAPPRDAVTALFAARNSGASVWSGMLLRDGIEREVAFVPLFGMDELLAVGVGSSDALASARGRSAALPVFAAMVSLLLIAGAVMLIRQIEMSFVREERLAEDRNLIESAYGELAQAKSNSERKSAEIEATLTGMTDGVMMLDSDLRLVNWNDRFAERIGIPRNLLRVGMHVEDIMRYQIKSGEFGDNVDEEVEVRRRLADLRAVRGYVISERQRPNGMSLEMRRSRLPDGGLVTLYIDVTARKAAEDALRQAQRLAEEAAEQKSRFVAIVSHEIRTPLNAVVNCLGLLNESDLSPPQRRLADTAREAGEALMDLVNDILELSNAESGSLLVRPAVFDLAALLEGVRAMFQPAGSKRGIRFVADIAGDVPRQMRADPGRLRQVVMNLASNAAKFSQPGIVALRAELRTGAQGKPELLLRVRDPGPAISDDDAAKLFVPYSRLNNPATAGTPGTGLGLAICDRLMQAMGGEIGLRRAPGGGNEFWIALPYDQVDDGRRGGGSAGVAVLRHRPRTRVLIVEDIAANHLVAATILRREGFRVDVAESGAESIAMVQSMPYDLVLMDLIMPGIDGLEASRRIRALPGPVARVPIVALTATTSPEDRAHCIAAGMDDMLGKPIRPAAMFDLLQTYIGNPQREAQTAESPPVDRRATPPVIDDDRLDELRRGLPPATVRTLIDQCLDDIAQRLPILRRALAGEDARAIEIAAHALAGMSASYGLAAFESRLRRIIRHARAGELDAARETGLGAEADFAVATETLNIHLRAAVA